MPTGMSLPSFGSATSDEPAAQDFVHHPCAGERVARSLSAIR
jgi:hypothetical protein